MRTSVSWIGDMKFEGRADNHSIEMDAKTPIGKGQAMTPKDLVAAGLGGGTAMDVAALFKKHKQQVKSFVVEVDIETSTQGLPVVFKNAHLTFKAEGEIESTVFLEAVRLSQTKYCGVSAMLAQSFPIRYSVVLNGENIGEGYAEFGEEK